MLLLCASQAMAADVRVQLQGVQGPGIIRAALINAGQAQWPAVPLRIAISEGGATLAFTEVPAGQYAIALYQDRNGNAQLDQSLRGIPQEPVGFSNNPTLLDGKPKPAQCGFSHGETDTQLLIRLYAPPASGSAQQRG
ncbi:DUF2141 domain-containing protein [Pseudomonas sp. 5P_3.1_Bac2]|uniref:DUF2141 domain-containing protein n=1 Tax=Pseudomonas sp. 5P_3.1_Bac2 TaxID=2971617 RepID=UPI0021C77268|nr:DUF2141 domain-containing protein [Pseudomonas sp. 5P_3.1_Bac2]MCU1717884.1 DUF2141 domain-containing protein [Pseudomonas sp. 5P_3.1_Bac2]